MITLDEFNKTRKKEYDRIEAKRRPHPNGIICPDCGKELWDSNPTMVLPTNPPKKDIHCPACGFRGYRLT